MSNAKDFNNETTSIILEAGERMLGINKDEIATAAWDLCETYKLDYSVEKVELSYDGRASGIFATKRVNGSFFEDAAVGADYQVFQNWNLAQLSLMVANGLDREVVSAGSLKNGAWPYIQLDYGTLDGIGKNNDIVKQFATVLTSHDGRYALKFGYTDLVISCQNTFHANSSKLGVATSVRKTKNMNDRLKDLLSLGRKMEDVVKKANEIYLRMDEVSITKEHLNTVLEIVTGVNPDKVDVSELHAKTLTKYNRVLDTINSEIRQKGATLWGLFNGVTFETTHNSSADKAIREAEKAAGRFGRLDNKVFSYLGAKALDSARTFVSAN